MNDSRYIDLSDVHPDFNVFRLEKFKLDIERLKINKVCMTEIVNADMMIATFGIDSYTLGCKEVLTQGRNDIKAMGLSHCVIHYMYNYKNFIVAATQDMSDSDFEKLIKTTYEQYMISTSKEAKLNALSRFVVVYGSDDIIDRANSAFYLHRSSQNNFIVASNERELLNTKNKEEVEVFELINYAINENKIIPYYQGIYNNATEKIEKYEALMRIEDSSGKVYPPGMFLDVAKKFKLYHTLSKLMIEKVFSDFDEKESEICINISLFDIESKEFSSWFIDRVKHFSNPNRLTIEFVETENYNTGEKLFDFLNNLKEIGCEIAVDDFGVGFANYTSIISLKPNIIKIDGQIIKNLPTNNDSKIILESICFMSKLIGAKTVAEFVENGEIQEVLLIEKVDYSQGYHFAKPQPLSELDIN